MRQTQRPLGQRGQGGAESNTDSEGRGRWADGQGGWCDARSPGHGLWQPECSGWQGRVSGRGCARGPGARKDRVLGGSGAHQPLEPESGRRAAGTLQGHTRGCPQSHPPAGPGNVQWGSAPQTAGGAKRSSPWPFPRARQMAASPRGTPPPPRALQGLAGPLPAQQPPGGGRSSANWKLRCRPPTGR